MADRPGVRSKFVPDFVHRGAQLRVIHSEIDRLSDMASKLDEAELAGAEVTDFLMAAALAAREHGLTRDTLASMLGSIAGDVWALSTKEPS